MKADGTNPEGIKRAQFLNQLKAIGGRSLWFYMIIALMCIPGFCHVSLHAAFLKDQACLARHRCYIPELEMKNWTYEEIFNISASSNELYCGCFYYMRNYTAIAAMAYDEALKYVQNRELPPLAPCEAYAFNKLNSNDNSTTIYQEFSLVCDRKMYSDLLIISPVYGKIIGCIFLVPLADIFGRKRVMKWGANIFIFTAPIVFITRSIGTIICGRILFGIAYSTMINPIEALVVELSNKHLRVFRFLALRVGFAFAFILIPATHDLIEHWRHLQMIASIAVTLLPLTTWYVPESPRWFMSKGKKAKAWAILRDIKDPETVSDLLLVFKNEKTDRTEEIKKHIQEFRLIIVPNQIILTLLFALTGTIYFSNFAGRFPIKSVASMSRSFYVSLSGIAEIFGYMFCLPLLLIFGRKITMMLSFFIASVAYGIASRCEFDTSQLASLLIIELVTPALYATVHLYVNECSPTSHRCTVVGLAGGIGAGVVAVLKYHAYSFTSEMVVSLIIAGISLIGVIVSYFILENKQESISDTVEEAIQPHSN